MIKVIEDLKPGRTKSVVNSISSISEQLNLLKEDIQINSDKYDFDALMDILEQIYNDIGDFYITVHE